MIKVQMFVSIKLLMVVFGMSFFFISSFGVMQMIVLYGFMLDVCGFRVNNCLCFNELRMIFIKVS